MDRKNNTGRQKNVTAGGGSVKKRGQAQTSGPVGDPAGYADRKQSKKTAPQSSSGQRSSLGGSLLQYFLSQSGSSGAAKPRKPLTLRRLLLIVIVVILAFLVLRWFLRSTGGMEGLLADYGQQDPSLSYSQQQPAAVSANAVLNTEVSNLARDKRTRILGNGNDTFTIMVYMCGSDLESQSSMATSDLQEMLNADISDNVNIIVETGGASKWNNDVISNKSNQRYQVTSKGLVRLEGNLGKKNMTDPDTLSDFIRYCKSNFPANRYALIMWDHGAGSAGGFGYDELFPGSSMSLGEMNRALDDADCEFDFIGFDACLMATFETSIMMERYSDYLIASEETEPGIGWYYTRWITELSKDTSVPTIQIGKKIIDDFISVCADYNARDKTTLSIIDLAELAGTAPEPFKAFVESAAELIDKQEYQSVAEARSNSREFGGTARLDQVDLIHLAQNIGSKESLDLVSVLNDAVKYNRTSPYISNANGLSIYFPYNSLSKVGSVVSTYNEIGMDEEYTSFIKSFASFEAGGQVVSNDQDSPFPSLLGQLTGGTGGADLVSTLLGQFIGGGDFSSITGLVQQGADWLDTDKMQKSVSYYEKYYLDAGRLALTPKNSGYVLSLSDEEWDLVETLNLNVFLDDGEGYIDLGLDNVYEFDPEGDLIVDYDGTWLAVNGQVVSYYFISEYDTQAGHVINGRILAMLNGRQVDLMVVFDDDNPYGLIIGARVVYKDETQTVSKGLLEIKDGDTIEFLCDYYSYDEEYQASYYLGDPLIVSGPLALSNVPVGDAPCMVTYRLTDIYNNTFWTPALEYTAD